MGLLFFLKEVKVLWVAGISSANNWINPLKFVPTYTGIFLSEKTSQINVTRRKQLHMEVPAEALPMMANMGAFPRFSLCFYFSFTIYVLHSLPTSSIFLSPWFVLCASLLLFLLFSYSRCLFSHLPSLYSFRVHVCEREEGCEREGTIYPRIALDACILSCFQIPSSVS